MVVCEAEHARGHGSEGEHRGRHHPVVPSPLPQQVSPDVYAQQEGEPDEEEADSAQDEH